MKYQAENQRTRDVDAAEQRQLVPAAAGPAEEQAAQHVETADHAERLRASIGSMPQIARYDGRCVVRNTSCMPQTK